KDGGTDAGRLEIGSDLNLWRTASGLVGYWPFEGTGAISNGQTNGLEDFSGNSNNGTASNVNGSGMTFTTGKVGSAVQFDGADDSIQLLSNTESVLGSNPNEWSYSIWFKKNSSAGKQEFLSNYDSVTGSDGLVGIWAGINYSANKVFVNVRGTGAPEYINSPSSYNYNDNIWHHFAVTAKKGSYVRGYIDGVELMTSTLGTSDYIDDAPLRTGALRYNSVFQEFLGGSTDEICIYSKILSASEVRSIYNAGK
ncbi:MAG: hypothetical protein PHG66_05225, partial [Candidatus Colwellbacteria bacterium]|nr:hypothetical protein [Candidatus Colwellbacteria bacterium]